MTPTVNDRFILAEETALKAKFEGLGVHDPRDPDGDLIPVDVWFRWPNKEIREVKYPFISLDLADVVKSDRREHQGMPFPLSYVPRGYEPVADENISVLVAQDWPVPYDFVYTVTVASLDPRHDRELKFKLLGDADRLPHRLAYLETEDGTVRRLDILSIDNRVMRVDQRQLFMTVFTLNVESELFASRVEETFRVLHATWWLKETTSGLTEQISL